MVLPESDSPLNAAIRQFELAEANLVKLERVWEKIEAMIPGGIVFDQSPDMENHCRSYAHILEHLPAIDGKRPTTLPMDLNEIAQCRFDAAEIDEVACTISTEDAIMAPGRELREYRFNLARARRQLVRGALEETTSCIEADLRSLKTSPDYSNQPGSRVEAAEWQSLKSHVDALAMILGRDLPRSSRWADLTRHLHFGQANDLRDIIDHDWPSVKSAIASVMFGEDDPLPVGVTDLADLVLAKPTGPIATKLAWAKLSAEDFERLVFTLVSNQAGYENPEWLMHTTAPDRGRDISVYRVVVDPLGGTIRSRAIIQCKHWLTKSVAVADISVLRDQMKLWEPPRVDVHIIATSGRFTADAVAFVEKHNQSDTALRIELWPESHLERLLAARPALIATYRLR
jgi:hypothetical protein